MHVSISSGGRVQWQPYAVSCRGVVATQARRRGSSGTWWTTPGPHSLFAAWCSLTMAKGGKRRLSRLDANAVNARLERAFRHHDAGDLTKASRDYAEVVAAAPSLAAAWHGYGVLALQTEAFALAQQRLEKATSLDSSRADYQCNLGAAFEALGQFAPAKDAYARALAIEPDDVDSLFNAALVEGKLGNPREACALMERAASITPADAEIWLNVARFQLASDEVTAAREACDRGAALCSASEMRQFDAQRGAIARHEGALEQAVAYYERAIAGANPDARVTAALGEIYHELGRYEAADTTYRRALAKQPQLTETLLNLASLQLAQGYLGLAYEGYREAYRRQPNPSLRRTLAGVLRSAHPSGWDAQLQHLLVESFADPLIDPDDLASAAAVQIAMDPHLRLERALSGHEGGQVLADGGTAKPLVLVFLRSTLNVSAQLESMLTRWRTWLWDATDGGKELPVATWDLLGAFAEQTFSNEFVWQTNAQEQSSALREFDQLDTFLTELAIARELPQAQALPQKTRERIARAGIRTALYMNLGTLSSPNATMLAEQDWRAIPAFERLIERCIVQPQRERHLSADLEAFGAIDDGVSVAVRAQYEEHPYPRWLTIADGDRAHLRDYLRRLFPIFEGPWLTQPFRALVAGCGTGQEPLRLALACPNAQVTGVDLSLASLGYARRKADELDVSNVTFLHGDLMSVGQLGTFDLIVANGVLHHMDDPQAGWRALRTVLTPGGLMKIGLYSECARAAVVAARAVVAERHLSPDLDGIRALRTLVFAGEIPQISVLANSDDFYCTSGCRDLVFHACEHRFTIERIAASLENLGLDLVGFEQVDGVAQKRFGQTQTSLPALARWASVEAQYPQTFEGMYQFWVQSSR
ncbi:MAG: tetratricopeptide (TPR) repeat protein/SAM-dependent methyltransferase [Gammaproteobacteria bacterium]